MIHESIKRNDERFWDSKGIVHNGNLLFDILHPIGSLYFSSKDTNPSVFFGGVWELVEDVFILTAGKKYKAGSTGGEAEHKLTVEEMPNHIHRVPIMNWAVVGGYETGISGSEGGYMQDSSSTGGDQPHNNMPPYKTFYCWQRVS